MNWAFLLLSVIANVAASLSLRAAVRGGAPGLPIAGLTLNWQLFTAVLFYGCAFLTYALALKTLPLHIAHPLTTSLPIAVIAIASVIVFNESLSTFAVLGVVLIGLGAILIGISA